MKKIIKIFSNIVMVVIIICAVLIAFTLLPIKNNFKILSVTGGSMEPALHVGELIVVKPASEYRSGDIISFKRADTDNQGSTNTHRITEKIDTGNGYVYQTKGDANDTVDQATIGNKEIIGKLIFGIGFVGYIIGYVKTLPGLILIIIIPATIIIYEEINKIRLESTRLLANKREKLKQKKIKKVGQYEKNS